MELPKTLHAQLYLLAYDRDRRDLRSDHREIWDAYWRIGFALRSAMLTDLYLAGFVEDRQGKACRVGTPLHDDPVLSDALENVAGQDWVELIRNGGRRACELVHGQLEDAGWIHGRRRRLLGFVPARLALYDDDMVGSLKIRVTEALRNVIADRPADPRPLALGLMAAEAQLPVVSGFLEDARSREQVRQMTLAAIEPILGLHEAMVRRYSGYSGGGGCGAGGCGGGCGGG
jgi:hypothetical protein